MAARDIQFVIKAQDEATRAFESIASALQSLMTAQGSLQGSTDGVNTDLTELLTTLQSFDKVSSTITNSTDRAAAAFDKQTAKIAELNAQLAAVAAQAKAADQALSNVKGAGAATGQDALAAQKVQAITAAQDQLSKSKANLVAQINREEATLKSLGVQYQRVASLENAMGQAKPMVGALGAAGLLPGGAKGVEQEAIALTKFGMAATTNARAITELVVLAREASRDNFSRMAGSATILVQALGLMKASFLVPFAGVAVAIGGVVVAMMAMADEAERLRALNAILRENADGANYNAKAIAANVDQLRAYRIAAADAMAAVTTFIKAGVNPQDFVAFGQTAKDSFKVDPSQFKDVKDAAKQVTDAFTGGYDAVVKLDDATNFLSSHERQLIRDMFDAGKASEARTRAFNDYRDSVKGSAGEMDSSLTPAAYRLADAWAHLGEALNDSKFGTGLHGLLDDFAKGLDRIGTLIEGKGRAYSALMLHYAEEEKAGYEADDPALAKGTEKNAEYTAVLSRIAALKKQIADYDKQSAAATAPAGKVDPKLAETEAQKKAVAGAQHELDLQTALEDATTSFDRIRVAGEQAYQAELEKTGNKQVAQIKRLEAEQKIRTEIERSAVATFTKNIVGAEGGGAQNPHSSAVGDGQFIASTWIQEFKKALPELAASLTNQQILDKRSNPDTAKIIIEQQARDLAEVLKKLGETVSATNLYLAHFLGPAGAKKVLDADPNTPVDQLGLGRGVLSGNQGYLRTDNGKGRYRTAGELQTFIAGRIGDTTNDQYGAERQAIADLQKKQEEFNRAIDDEAKKRQIAIKYLQQEQGATVDAKYAAERQKAIDEAVQSARAKAEKAGTVLSPDQQKDIENATGAVYDLEHAEKLVNDRLNEQQTLRDALLKGIKDAEQAGDTGTVAALTAALNDTDTAFSAAIDAAEKYWKQFDSPEAHAALEHLRELKRTIADTAAELAKAHLDAISQRIGGAAGLQTGLEKDVGTQQLLGNSAGAKQSERDLAAVNVQLVNLRQNAIDAATAMLAMTDEQLASIGQTREGLEGFILEQKEAQHQSVLMGRQFLQTGKQINEMLADELVSGMENFLTMVAQGKNVFRSLATAAAQTAANVLKSIGEMMLKQALFNALSAHSASGGGGVGGSIASAAAALFPASVSLQTAGGTLSAAGGTLTAAAAAMTGASAGLTGGGAAMTAAGATLTASAAAWMATAAAIQAAATTLLIANTASMAAAHTGGIAGFPTMHRNVSPLALAGAIRYHTGGIAGLRPNEVPTILERGEEVLTKNNPRHRNNIGRTGAGTANGDAGLKQVLVFHPDDIAAAMSSSEGRKVVLTHIQANRREIKTMLSS